MKKRIDLKDLFKTILGILLIGMMMISCSKKEETTNEEMPAQVSEFQEEDSNITEENVIEEADKLLNELDNL